MEDRRPAMGGRAVVIDMHVHLVGASPANGCFVNQRFLSGTAGRLVRYLYGLGDVGCEGFDDRYMESLLQRVEDSDLDAVGLLALDGVYDESGKLDFRRTALYVSNDYCLACCAASGKLLPVCSVNPQRKDALAELERVTAAGAVAINSR
jgi:uncharacterized protein